MYRLLIVDDEALIRKGLHQMIPWAEMGFTVAGVLGSSQEALTLLASNAVDVLLTDICMPGQTGLELAAAAKNINPHIRVVVISGYDRFDYAVTALKMQVDDYILKPLDSDIIRSTFLRLREKLDAERATLTRQRQRQHTENEYSILRLLGYELLDAQNFRRQLGNAVFIRLILVYIPAARGEARLLLNEELNELIRDCFCISTETLHAVFLPSADARRILQSLAALLEKHRVPDYKLAESQAFYHASDAYQLFLNTAEELHRGGPKQLIDMDAAASGANHCTALLKPKFAAILEEGSDAALEAELDGLLRQVRGGRLFTGIMLCGNLLRDMLSLFHIQGYSNFSLLDFAGTPAKDHSELEEMTRNDFRLLLKMLRRQAENPVAVLVTRAKRLIDQQYASPHFSLSALAGQLHLSYNYFSTVFSKEAGLSPHAYLTSVRMGKARDLILARKYKVCVIAQMVGYNNPRYFTDAFRNYYKMSPKDYAQKIGGDPDEA